MPSRHLLFFLGLSFLLSLSPAARSEETADFPPQPPILPQSAAEEAKSFQLPPGYHLELVVGDPIIQEPVMCSFDGNGRMFVAEMRTYMQEVDGKQEFTPTSRVSLHWSSKGDGQFDRHTVFADQLILPRLLLPLDKGRVLIGETNTDDIYLYTDVDGDGVSDRKELWFSGGERGGNLEHQPNGLLWAMDNWLYTTYNSYRLRWTPKGPVKESTSANGGQWGLTQDNHGRLFFMNAGGERGPQSFQANPFYGTFNPKLQTAPGFEEVWPLPGKADVQGGPNRFRPEDKTLNHFTATCGADIYRGDRLPEELQGNLFFAEPVGRLLRRATVENKEGLIVLSNPYQEQKSEFLRAGDQLFRPVNMTTAPDGTLFLVDMYRGIIQEGQWVGAGSYLRSVVQQYGLDKVTLHGRIWRLVHESLTPGPAPAMENETAAQLVAHLEHPNGWWRDMAQRLLVLRQDRSIVPALQTMAGGSPNYLARLHALWTLEGLEALETASVQKALQDSAPQVRAGAIRMAETLLKRGDQSLPAALQPLNKDADPGVVLQAMLTARKLALPGQAELPKQLIASNRAVGVQIMADLLEHPAVPDRKGKEFQGDEKRVYAAGQEIFNSLCAACHGPDGRGMPMVGAAPGVRLAPSFAASNLLGGVAEGPIFVLLHGLTGEIDGRKYEGQMISMATNNDEWIANVLSFVRNSFGQDAGFVTPQQVAAVRAATAQRTTPWTSEELRGVLPQPLNNQRTWKLTASHNPASAPLAVDGSRITRYESKTAQSAGMWVQVELPEETVLSGVKIDAGTSRHDYPRGYAITVSADGEHWSPPVAAGEGKQPIVDVNFLPVRAKFIRITQTGEAPKNFWSIAELNLQSAGTFLSPAAASAAR